MTHGSTKRSASASSADGLPPSLASAFMRLPQGQEVAQRAALEALTAVLGAHACGPSAHVYRITEGRGDLRPAVEGGFKRLTETGV